MKAILANKLGWLRAQPGVDEPLVRWGLIGIVVICLWAVIFVPYLGWRDMRLDSIEVQSNKAVKTMAFQASAKAWKQSFEAHAKATEVLTGALFQDSSYAGAQAALLRTMVALVGQHHLTLGSQRLLDMESEQGFGQRVAVLLRVQGAEADVMSFIDAVANSDKLIVLDKLYINRDRDGHLLLQFQATGFRLVGEAS